MSFNSYRSLLLVVFFAGGCGDKGEAALDDDTPAQSDPESDTGIPADECTFNGFESGSIEISDGYDWFLLAKNEAGDGGLRVESWGQFDGPTDAGEYTVGGNNYADCALCVMMYEDCSGGDISADSCDTVYFGSEGTAEIITFDTSGTGGGPVEIKLTDVVFKEVTINPYAGYLSTEVEDGNTWCVDETYTGTFRDYVGAGDAMPEFTAPDQTGADVSSANMSGTMGVISFNAGDWCPPCEAVAETHEALFQAMQVADERYGVSFVEMLVSNNDGNIASQGDAAAWAERFEMTYPVLHGVRVDAYFTEHVGAYMVPAYWIVDPLGQVRAWETGQGSLTAAVVQEHFEAFLSDNPDWTRDTDG